MADTPTAPQGVVAIGGSAGGVAAITELAANLPKDLPFAVMVVVHMPAAVPSVLARIIDRAGPLPAVAASHGAELAAGHIYVAVPGYHLLSSNQRIVLSDGPQENGHRPSIDALFRSAAVDFGQRAIGVLMSGLLDDGVAGLAAIKSRGGVTIVQEPTEALFPDMPRNALAAQVVDHTGEARKIGDLLMQLADRGDEEQGMDPDGRIELENRLAMGDRSALSGDLENLGQPAGLSCPKCKGTLIALGDNAFRCPVGHAWTARALMPARDDELEDAISLAIRSLSEKAKLCRELAETPSDSGDHERYIALAQAAEDAITALSEGLSKTIRGNHAPGVAGERPVADEPA